MNLTETITVNVLSLLLALLALVAVAYFVGWVSGLRAERSSWIESANTSFALVCEDHAYRVLRLDARPGPDVPAAWDAHDDAARPHIRHRVTP